MTIEQLTDNSKAILLLCGRFGRRNGGDSLKPLATPEYNTLVIWLRDRTMRPADLLLPDGRRVLQKARDLNLDLARVGALLDREADLAVAAEKWLDKGLWIISRNDETYPKMLRDRLKKCAPPLLFGVGEPELLTKGGLAVVGSRNIDDETCEFTERVARACARDGFQVVSGGARGVDLGAMLAALDEGGTVVGVLADGLLRAGMSAKYRQALREKALVLVSPYYPEAKFNVRNAMGRNKCIYALADYGLVVSTSYNKGGTWSGAIEELRKDGGIPVFVRVEGNIPDGNRELMKKGARSFPETPWNRPLRELLVAC